ncbi:MAG TPA: VOC family protein [Steroidobacteraceae bacterium]|nr:VOC family protein [Steroidobacteraceae bacterium]
MERIFGPVMQNAFVVADLRAALDHWTRVMAVGPFYLFEHIEFEEVSFRGNSIKDLQFSVAIGYWGDIQIELIQQRNAVPSIYTEFMASGRQGMQHMGVVTESLDRDLARLAPLGVTPVQHGRTATGLRFAYVSTDFHPGGMIELIEAHAPTLGFFEMMRREARGWDGRDPLRPVG